MLKKLTFYKNVKRYYYDNRRLIKTSFENFFQKNYHREFYRREIKIVSSISKFFKQIIFLVYFFDEKILYVDIDVSKRREFEIMIYHLKFNYLNFEKLKRVDIESIFFLNRILNAIETKYRLTKLKITSLI